MHVSCVCVCVCVEANLQDKGALSSPYTEGIRARGLTAEHLIDNRNWKCVCICICVCVCPANTRVKHKAIQLSTSPRGEGQTGRGGLDDGWTDGWKWRPGEKNERKRGKPEGEG